VGPACGSPDGAAEGARDECVGRLAAWVGRRATMESEGGRSRAKELVSMYIFSSSECVLVNCGTN